MWSCGTEDPHRHNRPSREPIEIQRKWPFESSQELEQVNDRTGRSPRRIRHSLARDLVTRLHLDPNIFDARPLARLHDDKLQKEKKWAGGPIQLYV